MRTYRVLFFLLFIVITTATNLPAEKIYITGKKVNIRSGPGTIYDTIGTTRKDDYFERIESVNSWSQIILPDGKTGWISDQFISLKKPNDLPEKVYVIAQAVNIRVGPGVNYNKLTVVKENDELEPIKSLNGWVRVILPNGETGWISEKFISEYNDGFVYSDSILQFRSFKWGSTKSQILRQLKEEGYSFTLDNDELLVFLKELFGHECQVGFHFVPKSKQLFMIELLWPQIDISERAKRILVYKYGVPNQKDEKTGDLIWVDGDISLKLETDLKDTKIYYTHSKLSELP